MNILSGKPFAKVNILRRDICGLKQTVRPETD